jgi:hypothetical protein
MAACVAARTVRGPSLSLAPVLVPETSKPDVTDLIKATYSSSRLDCMYVCRRLALGRIPQGHYPGTTTRTKGNLGSQRSRSTASCGHIADSFAARIDAARAPPPTRNHRPYERSANYI